MEHDNYRYEPVYKVRGEYYYDKEGKQKMDNTTAEARMQRNAQKEQYKREYQGRSLSDNRQVVSANQAQEAMNRNTMQNSNASYQAFNETENLLAGEDKTTIANKINEAQEQGLPYITTNNGTQIPIQHAVRVAGLVGHSDSIGSAGGVTTNINTTFKGKTAEAINALNNPNASEEEKQNARAVVEASNTNQVNKLYEKMGKYTIASQQMQRIAEQDRLNTFLGFMSQYVGGDLAKEYGYLNASQSSILTSLATSALSGTLSTKI